MKYCHVFIQSLEKRGLWRQGISFDNSKENMTECIISPFNERKPFRFGEDPHEADMHFLIHSLLEGKVKGVRECSAEHILTSKSEKS
jgi:hypothetical protein